jgi:hypothetical protein
MAAGFDDAIKVAIEKLAAGGESRVHLEHPFSGFYLTYEPGGERVIREITVEGRTAYLAGGII